MKEYPKLRSEARTLLRLALAIAFLVCSVPSLPARQDAASSSATPPAAAQQDNSQPAEPPPAASSPSDASGASGQPSQPPSSQTSQDEDAPKSSPAPATSAQSQPPAASSSKNSAKDSAKAAEEHTYPLSSDYSVVLSSDWTAGSGTEIPPPAGLGAYAPFHLSGALVLSNTPRGAILQFATSNNPFIGHDAYWLDTQMHAPSGSGMSLLDFFFYYFFPPSDACMHQILTTHAPASRQSPMDGPAYMQVYYSCPLSDTLSDFYSAQISAGITFQHTDDGTRVLAPIGDFYVAPMEELDESGITFYVFEAQGMNAVSSDATKRFHLPATAQGGAPDFFWAIGAPSPFPFVADDGAKQVPILHVAYARLGADADAKTEFFNILRQIRTH